MKTAHLYTLWATSLIIKLALGAWLPLSADESYYWVWSHHLQWSYYDHPLLVALLYWLGQPFEYFASAVRWPGIIVAHLAFLPWLAVLKNFLSPQQLFNWLLLALTAPLIGWGALIITPDTPMLLFWSLLIWSYYKWNLSPQWSWAACSGIFLGLGLCSKYLAVLALPILLFLVSRGSHSLRAKINFILFLVAGSILASFPLWWWNLQNNFVSFRFQLDHGLGSAIWRPEWTISYLLGQACLLFPVVIYYASKARQKKILWLHLFCWPILLFFFTTSFRAHVEANWPVMVTPALLALSVVGAQTATRWIYATAGLWLCVFLLLTSHLLEPWIPGLSNNSKLRELTVAVGLVPQIEKITPLYARSYQLASKLSFELKRSIPKLNGMNRKDFYDFIPSSFPTQSPYFVIMLKDDTLPPWAQGAGHTIKTKTPLKEGLELVEVVFP